MSAAHSTCLGFGWYTCVAGSLRGTEQYRPASTGEPCAVTSALSGAFWGALSGATVNASGFPVFALFASIDTGCASAGSTAWSRASAFFDVSTFVTTASPVLDTTASFGASSFTTAGGSCSTVDAVPVMNTLRCAPGVTPRSPRLPRASVFVAGRGPPVAAALRTRTLPAVPSRSMNTRPPEPSGVSLNGTPEV